MKSKTKTILIFAAILAAVFLIAFLDGGAVQSAADEEEEGTLIGAFVSEEDIDIGGDLAVSAAGKFVWKAGRLYMDTDEDWWALKDRGSGIYCTMEPDSRDGEEDAKSPCITNFGTLGAPHARRTAGEDGHRQRQRHPHDGYRPLGRGLRLRRQTSDFQTLSHLPDVGWTHLFDARQQHGHVRRGRRERDPHAHER